MPTFNISLKSAVSVIDLLVEAKMATSKSEARRLIEGGGVKCNDVSVTDIAATVSANDLTSEGHIKLSAGKKRHALVKAA